MIKSLNNVPGMGFEGIVMKVSVKDFLFGGIKTGTAGWMIGLRKDQPQHDVLYVTDRLPTTAFGRENGFALFNHKNDTMENEWYEVSVSTSLSTFERKKTIQLLKYAIPPPLSERPCVRHKKSPLAEYTMIIMKCMISDSLKGAGVRYATASKKLM